MTDFISAVTFVACVSLLHPARPSPTSFLVVNEANYVVPFAARRDLLLRLLLLLLLLLRLRLLRSSIVLPRMVIVRWIMMKVAVSRRCVPAWFSLKWSVG